MNDTVLRNEIILRLEHMNGKEIHQLMPPDWSWEINEDHKEMAAELALNIFKGPELTKFLALNNNITTYINQGFQTEFDNMYAQMELAASGLPTEFDDDMQIWNAFVAAECLDYFNGDNEKLNNFRVSNQIAEFIKRCMKKYRQGVTPSNEAEIRLMKEMDTVVNSCCEAVLKSDASQ
jgi:hypothetical protein